MANDPCQVLTGATGGLGAHILAQLLQCSSIERVYCLLRGPDASSRLQRTLKDRHLDIHGNSKLSILITDLSAPKLGLTDPSYTSLLSQVTHIIHCAWPVTFQLALPLDVKFATPARFLLCSSISTALGNSSKDLIPEAPIENLEQASLTGYAQSKLVGEHIVQAAVQQAGANTSIFRIGQIVGDTKSGRWNDSEALPLVIRSALTMGMLPEMELACEWLPVDTLAQSIIQISGIETNGGSSMNGSSQADRTEHEVSGNDGALPSDKVQLVYNLVSPHTFSWTNDLLPALSSAGLSFRPTQLATWVHQLRSLSLTESITEDNNTDKSLLTAASDATRNPAIKLIDFYEDAFQNENALGNAWIKFETKEAQRRAPALRHTPKITESGLLTKMVGAWMQRWKVE
ncbi:MAG: hypothetical protein Q9170_001268 [Blastenia crenularia]